MESSTLTNKVTFMDGYTYRPKTTKPTNTDNKESK